MRARRAWRRWRRWRAHARVRGGRQCPSLLLGEAQRPVDLCGLRSRASELQVGRGRGGIGFNVALSGLAGSADLMATSLSYTDCLADVDAHLSKVAVSEDGPAVILSWSSAALSSFVDAANALDGAVASPAWLSSRGSITPESLVDDIMACLAAEAGGRWGRVLLAPNSVVEFGKICALFGQIENDAFMREAGAKAGLGGGSTLATVFCLTSGSAAGAEPMSFPADQSHSRVVFS